MPRHSLEVQDVPYSLEIAGSNPVCAIANYGWEFPGLETLYWMDRPVKACDVEDLIAERLRFAPHRGGKERQVNHGHVH
ncbi:UNVERIFIED_CONTAM: hypothetical protein FKN15_052154 [Acipenser sinensis]